MTTLIRTQTPITDDNAPLYVPFLHKDITHRWNAATVAAPNGATITEVPDASANGMPAVCNAGESSPWTIDKSEPKFPVIKTSTISYDTTLRAGTTGNLGPSTCIMVVRGVAVNQRAFVNGSYYLVATSAGWSLQRGSESTAETGQSAANRPTFAIAVCDGTSSALYTPQNALGAGTIAGPNTSSGITIGGHTAGASAWYDAAYIPRAITATEAADIIARIRAAYPSMPR